MTQTTEPSSPDQAEASRRLPRWVLGLAAVAMIVGVVGIATLVFAGGDGDPTTGTLPDLAALGLEDNGPSANATAPDFTVPTRDGGTFTLSDHLATDGRPVFLNLWASWCPPCRAEMPAIQQASIDHPDVLFIGVSVQDDRVAAQAFADEIGVTYTIGYDDENVVDAGYAPLGLPATYLISADGEIVERLFGGLTEQQIAERLAAAFGG